LKPYYEDKWVKIFHGDCREILPTLPDNSVDLVLTDPPYGIGFMGKDWDKALPDKQIWVECFRVLKDGAFAFVMSIPRADCLSRMIISLEDAGFWVNFTPIFWAYASGFPKAQNIGKAVDKRRGCDVSKYIIQSGKSDKEIADYCGVTSTLVRFWRLDERQIQFNEWRKLKEYLGIKNEYFDANLKEVERDIIGTKIATIGKSSTPERNYGYKKRTKEDEEINITIPATPQAKALDGSYGGFQPKPAVEVVIVTMKPLSEKTLVDQALKNQKGITWLDEGRIPYESEGAANATLRANTPNAGSAFGGGLYAPKGEVKDYDPSKGRFPANLLASDDVLNDGKVTNNSRPRPIGGKKKVQSDIYGEYEWRGVTSDYNDSGSFSRYFDLDAWFSKRLQELPQRVQKTFPFLIVPKASKSEKNKGCEDLIPMSAPNPNYGKGGFSRPTDQPERQISKAANNHPTVKPLKLMSYLITLGSRSGDVVLDPFAGSGTTPLACQLLNRKCISIEIEEKYCEINANRCRQEVMELKI